jgi:capsular exopolysaccharide synthesis family protein
MMARRKPGNSNHIPLISSRSASSSPFLDSYRRLYRRILYAHTHQNIRSIGVTSAQVGEGKSVTCINLALSMAEDAKRQVLLIDCDFRRPQIGGYLGIQADRGLGQVIEGTAELNHVMVPLSENQSNLKIVPTGSLDSDVYSVLYAEKLQSILRDTKKQFDFVIVDTPPIVPVPDQSFISDALDGVLLIVRPETTSKENLKTAIESMERQNILGIVVNACEKPNSSYDYYYYYNKKGAY